MSTLAANNITDAAGTGGPTLANGLTIGTSVLAAPSGSAPSYTCRAWVNFNGTGTVAIREDGNVTSITDGGTGTYTVNFTTAMPDANYVRCVTVGALAVTTGSNVLSPYNSTPTTTALGVTTFNTAWSAVQDCNEINVAIFR